MLLLLLLLLVLLVWVLLLLLLLASTVLVSMMFVADRSVIHTRASRVSMGATLRRMVSGTVIANSG